MKNLKSNFAHVLETIGELPDYKTAEPISAQGDYHIGREEEKDRLNLSVQAKNSLKGRKRRDTTSEVLQPDAQAQQQIDAQGNRVKISVTANSMAADKKCQAAWETPLHKNSYPS